MHKLVFYCWIPSYHFIFIIGFQIILWLTLTGVIKLLKLLSNKLLYSDTKTKVEKDWLDWHLRKIFDRWCSNSSTKEKLFWRWPRLTKTDALEKSWLMMVLILISKGEPPGRCIFEQRFHLNLFKLKINFFAHFVKISLNFNYLLFCEKLAHVTNFIFHCLLMFKKIFTVSFLFVTSSHICTHTRDLIMHLLPLELPLIQFK